MGKKKILIVEDDKDILTILRDQLELDNYEVKGAITGEEALKLFESFAPDLILLDLMLPDIDGIIICQQIRKRSNVPIIMLTARDALQDRIRGLEVGADDYVIKPFEYLELAARIKACLRRSSMGKDKQVSYGSIKIDHAKRQVFINDKPVKLTKKEYDLLDLLASNSGKVLSRDFLCGQLWPNKEVYSWSRALDVHIRRLRKKIEPDPENPRFILTHPGVGYRFEPSGE